MVHQLLGVEIGEAGRTSYSDALGAGNGVRGQRVYQLDPRGVVAKMVLDYLNQVPEGLGFSIKQTKAIESWRKKAHKAAIQNKEPSKTGQSRQTGKSKKKKLKKKK